MCGQRRNESEPRKQLELAVDRHVPHAGRIDPLANGVVLLAARVLKLLALDVDRLAREEVVAATVVEVQVGVDDDIDAGEVEVLLAERGQARIHVGHQRVQLGHAGVDQHACIGMVDDVHIDRHPLALGEQVGNLDRGDGDRGGGGHRAPTAAAVVIRVMMSSFDSSGITTPSLKARVYAHDVPRAARSAPVARTCGSAPGSYRPSSSTMRP